MVVDVSVTGSTVKVDRVVAALDCGIAVNPDVIKAQIERGEPATDGCRRTWRSSYCSRGFECDLRPDR
jgi:hypothetical protein